MTPRVMDIKKNLAPFMQMVDENNDIYLSKYRARCVEHFPSKQRIPFRNNGKLPEFDVWIKKSDDANRYAVFTAEEDEDEDECESSSQDFQRLASLG